MGTRFMGLTLLFLLMIIFTHGCGEESPFDGEKPEGYFPIAVGNVWTYQTEEGEYDVTMITGTRNIDGRKYHMFETTNPEESAMFLFEMSNPEDEAMFREASDGIYYAVEDGFAQELRSEIESNLFEGTDLSDAQVTVSPPDEWLLLKYPLEFGTSWDVFAWEVLTQPAFLFLSVKMTAKVVGFETIRVPAGQFDAVKVDYTIESEAAYLIFSGSSSVRISFWLARDVGIIKAESEDEEGIAHVNQLVSYKHLHH